MYQVTIKGRDLSELKKAVADINIELNGGPVCNGMDKVLDKVLPTVSLDIVDKSEVIDTPVAEVIAAAVETPVQPVVAELDIEGLPWDKRIHASSKAKVKSGAWKTKKGIDKTLLASLKEEIRQAAHLASNPTPVPPMPTTPVIAPVVPLAPVAPVVVEPVVAPVATPVVVPPQPAGGHTVATFSTNFPMILAELISQGKVAQPYIEQLKEYFKVTEIWNISEAQKAEVFESFAGLGLITKVG